MPHSKSDYSRVDFTRRFAMLFLLTLFFALPATILTAAEPQASAAAKLKIAAASPEAERAISGFQLPQGWVANIFAAEPMMANPVAFSIAGDGSLYVAETYRQSAGVEDNRSHTYWIDDDLAAKTVEDRRAFMLKHHADDADQFTRFGEQLRLLQDTTGDGVADTSSVFSDGYNDLISGSAAGVLPNGDDVYFACIPDLWLLNDKNKDGVAETKKSLFHGFGVHMAYKGHDLHGLIIGPDGKLYFSIGDRGFNVQTADGAVVNTDSGAVLRCNLDGSNLEIVHRGLRNPQELAFDDYGNLFTIDNDSDSYDESRAIPIIDGGDSGWRMEFQYFEDRGPFFRENLWQPYAKERPAYLAPTIANIASGPSGLAYYPGTGLSEDYRGRFLLCDFRGGVANSGIHSFRIRPHGAFYELVDREQPIWNILATDVDFGPDGAVYVSDWVHGWNGEGKGRIYRFVDTEAATNSIVAEVQTLLRNGVRDFNAKKLAKLLGHQDRRIRQMAQFELARQKDVGTLDEIARSDQPTITRLHAIWALGQIHADTDSSKKLRRYARLVLRRHVTDSDDEVRAQACKVVGEARLTTFASRVEKRLTDESPRVRYFATMALSHIGSGANFAAVLQMVEDNNDKDPMLRHAGVMAMARLGNWQTLATAAQHRSPAVRLATAVALRKNGDERASWLLNDPEPHIGDEAARAIHDEPISEGMSSLAAFVDAAITPDIDDGSYRTINNPMLRRALNANFRIGDEVGAVRLATFAACEEVPEHLRVEALKMLGTWAKPGNRDRVLGSWRPLANRDNKFAAEALAFVLPKVLSASPDIRSEAARAAARLNIKRVVPVLEKIIRDRGQAAEIRADSLDTLAMYEEADLMALLAEMVDDDAVLVRISARRAQANRHPNVAVAALKRGVQADDLVERQAAWLALTMIDSPAADAVIGAGLAELQQGKIPADTQLDVLLAAAGRDDGGVADALNAYHASRDENDILAFFRETLAGGDVTNGYNVFHRKREVSCRRCHRIAGRGGGLIGPDLSSIGKEKTAEYLLESLVAPNRAIAKGFEPVQLVTDEGVTHSGIVQSEDETTLHLLKADGKTVEIAKATIDERGKGQSAMPTDLVEKLTLRELRDLIAYLVSLKGE